MAEFCLECWNRINESHDTKRRYILSVDNDLCEGCGQYKRVIVVERLWSRAQRSLAIIFEDIKHSRS